MRVDESTKNAVQMLAQAIQQSVDDSPGVKMAVQNLEVLGYVPNFTVKMDLELLRPLMDGVTDNRVRIC